MKIETNNESIEVNDGQLTTFEGVTLIGKGYKNTLRPWTQILNENFLSLASKLKGVFVSLDKKVDKTEVHTKEEINTLLTERLAELLGSAPEAYDTLGEIAAKLQSDDNAFSVINDILQNKANTNHTHSPDHAHSNKAFLDGLSQATFDAKSDADHSHLKKYFFGKSTQLLMTAGAYLEAFKYVNSSSGISPNSDGTSIVLPAGLYLVDVSLVYCSFSSAGLVLFSIEYGGVLLGDIRSYSPTSTAHDIGSGHIAVPVFSDGVKALKLKCGNATGSPKPIFSTSIVEL